MILARPYRRHAETRSAYYLVRVLADPDADGELPRGAETAFTLAGQHHAQTGSIRNFGVSGLTHVWCEPGGEGQFLGAPGSPVEVSPGQVLVIPRGNWHEISNVSAVDSQFLLFFSGVGAVEDIGYEAYKGETTPSLGAGQ